MRDDNTIKMCLEKHLHEHPAFYCRDYVMYTEYEKNPMKQRGWESRNLNDPKKRNSIEDRWDEEREYVKGLVDEMKRDNPEWEEKAKMRKRIPLTYSQVGLGGKRSRLF